MKTIIKFVLLLVVIGIILAIIIGAIQKMKTEQPPEAPPPVVTTGPTAPPPGAPEPPEPPPAAVNRRSFLMGTTPLPIQPLSADNWIKAFDQLKQNGEIVLHHTAPDWADFASGQNIERKPGTKLEETNFVVLMARQRGLKVLLVVDPLRADRLALDDKLPSGWGTNFSDPQVRQAYKNYAVRMAKDYQPDWLALGSEVNTYLDKHPADAVNWLSLYSETYDLVKAVSSRSRVTATIQFEKWNGLADGRPAANLDGAVLNQFLPKLDVVAISTYPSVWFKTPADIPADYYSRLKKVTTKPIIIAESGWPSAGAASFHGSPENQAAFISRLPVLAKDLNLQVWIWWFLHDWDGAGFADYFKTMGLNRSNGAAKPAWPAWQAVQDLRLAN